MSWSVRGLGKEFPDMRQNERRMAFIRMGDAVRGNLKGKGGSFILESLIYTYHWLKHWE